MPTNISPMLAALVDNPFDAEGWTYEVKWDGYRALAFLNNGKVQLSSRNRKSFNEKFYPVHKALQKLKMNVILDGEIIVAGEEGLSNFVSYKIGAARQMGSLSFMYLICYGMMIIR